MNWGEEIKHNFSFNKTVKIESTLFITYIDILI